MLLAGHKGHPEIVAQQGRAGRRLKGKPGRGTLAGEKPPILGMIERGGKVVIQPLLRGTIQVGSTVFTDEYNIYARLEQWGYRHFTVNHAQGEYALDDDEHGFCETHLNTMEGFWSRLRSWLRPHRGISQEH